MTHAKLYDITRICKVRLVWAALTCLATALPGLGATIAYGGVDLTGYVQNVSVAAATIPSIGFSYATGGGGSGVYFLIANGCLDGWCPAQGAISGQINFPITLRFTNVEIRCQVGGLDCGPLNIKLISTLTNLDTSVANGLMPGFASLSGSDDATVPVTGSVFARIGTSVATFGFTTPADGSSFRFSAPLSRGVDLGSTLNLEVGLTLDGLPAGATFLLPNSLDLTLGAAAAVPEPDSLLLTLSGILVAPFAARKLLTGSRALPGF